MLFLLARAHKNRRARTHAYIDTQNAPMNIELLLNILVIGDYAGDCSASLAFSFLLAFASVLCLKHCPAPRAGTSQPCRLLASAMFDAQPSHICLGSAAHFRANGCIYFEDTVNTRYLCN